MPVEPIRRIAPTSGYRSSVREMACAAIAVIDAIELLEERARRRRRVAASLAA